MFLNQMNLFVNRAKLFVDLFVNRETCTSDYMISTGNYRLIGPSKILN